MRKWLVEIVETKTHKAVERIECDSERAAERVERGVLINLNRDDYHTRIVEVLQCLT